MDRYLYRKIHVPMLLFVPILMVLPSLVLLCTGSENTYVLKYMDMFVPPQIMHPPP